MPTLPVSPEYSLAMIFAMPTSLILAVPSLQYHRWCLQHSWWEPLLWFQMYQPSSRRSLSSTAACSAAGAKQQAAWVWVLGCWGVEVLGTRQVQLNSPGQKDVWAFLHMSRGATEVPMLDTS